MRACFACWFARRRSNRRTAERGRHEVTEAEARGLAERAALEQSRRATLPADPNGYKLELPKDFQIPQGVEFKLDPNSEAARLARDFAHSAGLSQEQFSKLVAIYAAERVAEQTMMADLRKQEIDKLGVQGSARVTAINNFLRAHFDADTAQAFMATLATSRQVAGWEKIMSRLTNQSASTFSQQHRAPPEPEGRVTEQQYQSMSAGERLDYARRFPQGNGRN